MRGNASRWLLCGLERGIFSTHSGSTDCLSGLHADSDQLDWEIKYCWRVRQSGAQSQSVIQAARQFNSSQQSVSETEWQQHRLRDSLNWICTVMDVNRDPHSLAPSSLIIHFHLLLNYVPISISQVLSWVINVVREEMKMRESCERGQAGSLWTSLIPGHPLAVSL